MNYQFRVLILEYVRKYIDRLRIPLQVLVIRNYYFLRMNNTLHSVH